MNIKETVSRVLGRRGKGDDGNGEQQPAPDALELIRSDHREVDALFAVALGEETAAAQRRGAIAKILQALTVHAEMEEALFYPALRKAGGKDERDSVLEANEEHGMVKDMIAKIESVRGRDETLEAKVTVLKELVQHHVKEEESTIFDEARKALGEERLQQLGEEMQRFKERRMRGGRGGRTATGRGASGGAGGRAKKSSAGRSAAKKSGAKKSAAKKSGAKKSGAKKRSRG
ncbi:MAG TPA: hemerythrin domain-containing protein [Candidatus Elarobacter sp.]|nr:hemerythrin domain-containing protein [Candidatus Elarobacter sp.]